MASNSANKRFQFENSGKQEVKKLSNKGNAYGRDRKRSRSRSPSHQARNKQGRQRSPYSRMTENESSRSDSEFKLYVGNLPKATNLEDLKTFIARLVRKGSRVDVRDVISPSGSRLRKTFAILQFLSKNDVRTAIKLNGAEFKGCKLILTPVFSSKEGAPARNPGIEFDPTIYSRTLWIWNVPYGVLGEELMDFFNHLMIFTGLVQSSGNPVVECRAVPNEECYILVLRSVAETAQVLMLDGINYMGSSLTITRPDNGPVAGPAAPSDAFQAALLPISERLDRIVYVANIVPGAVVEVMVKLFNQEMHLSSLSQGPGEAIVGFQYDPLKSVALLEFRNAAEARGAVALDGIAYLGRSLKIGWLTEFQQQNVNTTVPPVMGAAGRPMVDMDDHELNSVLEKERWGALAEKYHTADFELIARSAKLTAKSRAQRNQCQLYVALNAVGNGDCELELVAFLNKRMKIAGLILASGDPVWGCMLKKTFGFVEFRSVEETTNALMLDGVEFRRKPLTIKRPSNYFPIRGREEPVITRSQRTIHVNCDGITSEFYMAQVIYHQMLRKRLTLSPGNPVINCQSKDRGNYFSVLLRCEEEAVAALALDNTTVENYTIHVRLFSNQQSKKSEKTVEKKLESHDPNDEKQPVEKMSMKPDCRVFVSNFPIGISEVELKDFFNKLMIQTGLAEKPGDCIDCCEIIPDTNFAYLEFRSASEAKQALILDDLSFRGQKIRIKCPIDNKAANDAAKTQNINPANDNKISHETEPKPQQISEPAGFPSRSSAPVISSIIDHIEGMTSQVLQHVAEFQEKGYTGGAEFTAVADLLSVNISVLCANGARMTYHPKMGAASATIEIQNPKTRREASRQELVSYPSIEVLKKIRQESNLAKPSQPPVTNIPTTLGSALSVPGWDNSNKPSNTTMSGPTWDNSYKSSSSAVSGPAWDNSHKSSSSTVSGPGWDNSYKFSSSTMSGPTQDNSYKPTSSAVSGTGRDNSHQSSGLAMSAPALDNSYKSPATEVHNKPYTTTSSSSGATERNWLIATWNVRGVTSLDKQLAIDHSLNSESVEIAAVQETHLASSTFNTPNYKWLLSSDTKRSLQCGVGFLVRKDLVQSIVRWTPISDYLACLQLHTKDVDIMIITVLIPFDGSTTAGITMDRLVSILSVFSMNAHIFVVGDFNAQIGTNDVMGNERSLVGEYLGHIRSNKNGLLLLRLIREMKLFHLSSLLGNNGTIVTRTQGSDSAQVDHILGNCPSSVVRIAAGFSPKIRTDHKIMCAVISMLPCPKHSSISQ